MEEAFRTRIGGLVLLAAVLAAAGVSGQTQWVQVTPQIKPPRVNSTCMAYDSNRRVAVLFAGDHLSVPGTTWEWDGVKWTQVKPAIQPMGGEYAMAFDSVRGHVVMLGGEYLKMSMWAWDGFNWNRLYPKNMPPWRNGHAMAFDANRGRVVLFGGRHNDTWEWDGRDWTQCKPITSPQARFGHAIVYDAARRHVVLFGGSGERVYDDTWVWQGVTWIRKPTTLRPSPRYFHQMAYDAERRRVVLHGGWFAVHGYRGDTWEWDGIAWVSRVTTPKFLGRSQAGVVYHAATQRVVLFGGNAEIGHYSGPVQETWELRETHLSGQGAPRLGSVVTGQLSSPPDAGHGYQFASSFGVGPIPVGPLSLGLQMDVLFWVSVTDAWPTVFGGYRGRLDPSGAAVAKITIPNVTALIGRSIHSAFVVIDPGPTPDIRSVSNTFSFQVVR